MVLGAIVLGVGVGVGVGVVVPVVESAAPYLARVRGARGTPARHPDGRPTAGWNGSEKPPESLCST